MKRTTLIILVCLLTLLLSACQKGGVNANMANPASVYCQEHGGTLTIVSEAGGEVGKCTFADGSQCEEWAFMRGECQPGGSLAGPATAVVTLLPATDGAPTAATPAGETAQATSAPKATPEDGWLVYQSEIGGYRLRYPAYAKIENNSDLLQSISVAGPLTNGDQWPYITINSPANSDEFRPTPGADLEQWLVEHNLLDETAERKPDMTIAGEPAVHLRHNRSQQSYAFDLYYVAHAGQLYSIIIGHLGDKEDWALYEHFLQNFEFLDAVQ